MDFFALLLYRTLYIPCLFKVVCLLPMERVLPFPRALSNNQSVLLSMGYLLFYHKTIPQMTIFHLHPTPLPFQMQVCSWYHPATLSQDPMTVHTAQSIQKNIQRQLLIIHCMIQTYLSLFLTFFTFSIQKLHQNPKENHYIFVHCIDIFVQTSYNIDK